MKTSIKTLAYALAASMLLLACNDTGSNANSDGPDNPSVLCKQNGLSLNELSPSCISEDKKLVRISEMHQEEIDRETISGSMTYGSETGEKVYTLNGVEMSEEEYFAYMDDYWKRYREQLKDKRDLPIPCVVSDDAMGWTALLTDEEAAELLKEYGELLISEELGYENNGSNADNSTVSEGCQGSEPAAPTLP